MQEKHIRRLGITLALGASALIGACAGDDADDELGTDTAVAGGAVATGAGGAEAPAILGFVSMVDEAEVQASQLAQEKAGNAQVKEYANMMITEHSNHMRKVGELGQQIGANPQPPGNDSQLAQATEQLMQQLRSAQNGMAFDTTYIRGMVQSHQMALDELNQRMNAAQNAQVQQFLRETQTTVQQHLQRAQEIQGQLVGSR